MVFMVKWRFRPCHLKHTHPTFITYDNVLSCDSKTRENYRFHNFVAWRSLEYTRTCQIRCIISRTSEFLSGNYYKWRQPELELLCLRARVVNWIFVKKRKFLNELWKLLRSSTKRCTYNCKFCSFTIYNIHVSL